MPDLEGAHGFLTVLLPLHTDPCARPDKTVTSPAHVVREILAGWPTAQHSPACAASGLQSPFARSPITHLARFAVIDQPAFNGRDPQDAILTALNLGTPLDAEPHVDTLGRPYLLFCSEFDRARDASDAMRDYLLHLWMCMQPEWSTLLEHCEGWRGGGAAEFADYMIGCQVETTLPFNDYAVAPAPAGGAPALMAPLGAAALAALAALALVRFLTAGLPPAASWLLAAVAALGAFAAAAVVFVGRAGRRSSPWVEGLDLRTVLKALEVQRRFTGFVLDHQGAAPAELHAAFRAFIAESRPEDLDGPTQAPGVVPVAGAQP